MAPLIQMHWDVLVIGWVTNVAVHALWLGHGGPPWPLSAKVPEIGFAALAFEYVNIAGNGSFVYKSEYADVMYMHTYSGMASGDLQFGVTTWLCMI
jgi:hypothetical protein